jgi:predicted DCC family thiol-disulfide oxidoreductase YuxK
LVRIAYAQQQARNLHTWLPGVSFGLTGGHPVNAQPHASTGHDNSSRPVVFYDGNCPLCRREIAHYRRVDSANRLHWIDAANDPGSLTRHGLSLEQAMAELHVLDGAGRWQRGVDAFLVIWQHLPAYRWLAKLVVTLGLRRPLGYTYRQFAAWRYRRRCTTDSCTTGDRERARE